MNIQTDDMGNRIRLRRRELNIKQTELAEKLEISNNHMSSIETGKQKPSLDIFVSICIHLNVSPDYLLLGTMRGHNVPQDISEKLRLCSQSDIELVRNIIDLLIQRNHSSQEKNGYLNPPPFF